MGWVGLPLRSIDMERLPMAREGDMDAWRASPLPSSRSPLLGCLEREREMDDDERAPVAPDGSRGTCRWQASVSRHASNRLSTHSASASFALVFSGHGQLVALLVLDAVRKRTKKASTSACDTQETDRELCHSV